MTLNDAKKQFPRLLYEEILKKYQAAGSKNNGHYSARRASNLERFVRDESLAAEKNARFTTPVCIGIHSNRINTADADGISAKAVIDGLRHCGVLSDDTTAQIADIRYSQDKNKEESTIITISERIET